MGQDKYRPLGVNHLSLVPNEVYSIEATKFQKLTNIDIAKERVETLVAHQASDKSLLNLFKSELIKRDTSSSNQHNEGKGEKELMEKRFTYFSNKFMK